jgi:trans-aconitate methyltransferase
MQGDLTDLGCRHSFDALVGRFVLMFLPEPAAVLRKLTCYVRKGGVVAFQEMDISASRIMPEMPLMHQCGLWIRETFQRAGVDIQMGPKLYATFLRAGCRPRKCSCRQGWAARRISPRINTSQISPPACCR